MSTSDDDSDDGPPHSSDEEDQAVPPPTKRVRNNTVFPVDLVPWTDPHGVTVFETDYELRDALWVLAKEEFGGNPTNKVDWIKKGWDKNKDKEKCRKVYYCTYNHQSKCGFRIAIFQDKSSCAYTIVKGLVSQCSHSRNYFKGEALPKQVKTIVAYPTVVRCNGLLLGVFT